MLFFVQADLNKTLGELYGDISFETLMLSSKDYHVCKIIHDNYINIWERHLENCHIQWFGFHDLEHLHHTFIKSKLYSDIHRYPNILLETYIQWCVGKVLENESDEKNKSMDLFNVLKILELNQLLNLGL